MAQWEGLARSLNDEAEQLKALEELTQEAGNEEELGTQDLLQGCAERIARLERELAALELSEFLNGPYDSYPATLSIFSGAGGRDAADWAAMLVRMYARFAERRGWKVRSLHEHRDLEGGVKSATLEVIGKNAYGWLRREGGVHRLVRISPFDASKRRHTSFALVEALPVLPDAALREIEIRPEDIVLDTSRSSGPGGQNVNRRETAVRVTHQPTGIVVECQAERTQGANRERAMAMLRAKLVARQAQEHREVLQKERGGYKDVAWGNQIRSYVLHPYKLVKDHRTNVEHHDPESVLDGDLERFIEAEVRI